MADAGVAVGGQGQEAAGEERYDSLIEASGEFDFTTRSYPLLAERSHDEASLEVPEAFGFWKQVDNKRTRVYAVLDVVQNWEVPGQPRAEDALAAVIDIVKGAVEGVKKGGVKHLMELPTGIKPASALPLGATVSLIVTPPQQGRCTLLKYITFPKPLGGGNVVKMMSGVGYLAPWRPNTSGAKIAVQQLLDRVDGVSMVYSSVTPKVVREGKSELGRGGTVGVR